MKSSKERKLEKVKEKKRLEEQIELREKQLEVLSIEYEKLLAEYVQLHGAFVILQRSLKLLILDTKDKQLNHSHKIGRYYQTRELDNMEITVSSNETEERMEFGVIDSNLVEDVNENTANLDGAKDEIVIDKIVIDEDAIDD